MIRLFLIVGFTFFGLLGSGQRISRNVSYYLTTAETNSPLLQDYRNQKEIQRFELKRLKALYTRSKLEANGDILFVPIITRDNGQTSFQWNAQDGTDYYGYDLGESSGHLHGGITWTQPLLGIRPYKIAQEQNQIQIAIIENSMRLERHQIGRAVTEQYLLCLLDKALICLADSSRKILEQQEQIVQKLALHGIARQSDLHLLAVEQEVNRDLKTATQQAYSTHLAELNALCGISDSGNVVLESVHLQLQTMTSGSSFFIKQYELDSASVQATLRAYKLQYWPQLSLYVNSGIQASKYARLLRHLGWSAGLTFTWTIFDGRQQRWKERQAQTQISTIATYKAHMLSQNELRKKQCLKEIQMLDQRLKAMCRQLSEYDTVLTCYRKEIQAGQRSIVYYITVLRNKLQAERDCMTIKANRLLLINTYNYWNW